MNENSSTSVLTYKVQGNLDFSVYHSLMAFTQGERHKGARLVIDLQEAANVYDSGISILKNIQRHDDMSLDFVNCSDHHAEKLQRAKLLSGSHCLSA